MTLQELNNLSATDCHKAFLTCCTASSWVAGMVRNRPYRSAEELLKISDRLWAAVDMEGWLEACEGHPKIGDVDSLAKKYGDTRKMAGHEQSGMDNASMEVIRRLAKGNADYERKFGYIFIVCATGKSASEMLGILENRLKNDPEKELEIARAEQNKITRLRLEKLMHT